MRNLIIFIIFFVPFNSFAEKENIFIRHSFSSSENINSIKDIENILGFKSHINIEDLPYQTLIDELGITHEKYNVLLNSITVANAVIILHKKEDKLILMSGEIPNGLNFMPKLESGLKITLENAKKTILQKYNDEDKCFVHSSRLVYRNINNK